MNAMPPPANGQRQIQQLFFSALMLLSISVLLVWFFGGLLALALLPGIGLMLWQLRRMQTAWRSMHNALQHQVHELHHSRQTTEQLRAELVQEQAKQQSLHLALQGQFQHENQQEIALIKEQLNQSHQNALENLKIQQHKQWQAQLHSLTAQVPGAVFQLRLIGQGKCSMPYASEAMFDLFGLHPEQLREDAQDLLDLMQADQRRDFLQFLAQPEHPLQCDFSLQIPGKGQVWRACTARAKLHENGVPMWHGIFVDITERQKQTQLATEASFKAHAASQAKSAYLANMAHEIRTPMNVILGMSYLALETQLAPGQRDYLENIRLSAEHLLSLLNDILDMSKIEAGQLAVEVIDFDLQETVSNISKLMAGKMTDKGLRFDLKLAAEVPLALRGDPLRLSQVLINFIANAIKFTQQGGICLEVSCQQQDEHAAVLQFEVRDTGIGMNEAECQRMFQAFQQADSSTSRKYGGTGLGLAISKQLVELMGGQVGVESAPGKGSRFWFSVKLGKNLHVSLQKNQDNVLAAQEAAAKAKASMKGQRILLVEDQPLNQRVAQTMLKNAGAEVEIAGNGQIALDILAQRSFDCVLMDMQMPVMDGVAATRAIRANPALANQLVIAMTANASMHNQALCMAAGMQDFITKPIKPAFLYAALAKWLVAENEQENQESPEANSAVVGGFNLSTLSNLVGNDPSIVRKFALMFIDTLSQTMAEMEQACAQENWTLLITLAQSLHSEASSMDAMEFAQLCNQLRQLPGPQYLPQAGQILAKMRPIASEIDRHIAALPE